MALLAMLALLGWVSVALAATAPGVMTGEAVEVTKTTAKLTAMVNPEGVNVTGCEFKYGTTEGELKSSVPCSALPGAGTEFVPVSAEVSGLTPNSTYYFQIVASSEASAQGSVVSFKTIANAPVVVTEEARELKLTSALLVGTVNPEGASVTSCEFKYGTTEGELNSSAPCSQAPGSGNEPEEVSATLTKLTPGATYYFEVVATGEGGEGVGKEEEFETSADGLLVTNGNAREVMRTSATLTGIVNPGGSPVTSCEFEYGPTPGSSEFNAPCSPPPGSGAAAEEVSAAVTGLSPNATYYFTLVVENEAGAVEGVPASTFTTPPNRTAVITGETSGVTQTTATLAGTVDPEGAEVTSCRFEYGTQASLGTSVPCSSLPPVASSPIEVSVQVAALSPGTTYYYRLVAENVSGEEVGSVKTFNTLALTPPPVSPPAPSSGGPSPPKGPEPARPPALSSLGESNAIFRVGRSSTAPAGRISRSSPTGTVFAFALDQPAVVSVTFVREESGHRIGKSCVVGRRGAGKPACVRSHVALRLGRRARTGVNRLPFTGRVRGKALSPGAYRATFTASSLAGTSAPSTISFRVVAH